MVSTSRNIQARNLRFFQILISLLTTLFRIALLWLLINWWIFFFRHEKCFDVQEVTRELPVLARGTTDRPISIPSSNPKPELGCVNSVSTGFHSRKIPQRSFQAIFDPNLPPDNRPNYRRQPKVTEQEILAKERHMLIDSISPIDSVCRVSFPVVFVIFNIFYSLWILQLI